MLPTSAACSPPPVFEVADTADMLGGNQPLPVSSERMPAPCIRAPHSLGGRGLVGRLLRRRDNLRMRRTIRDRAYSVSVNHASLSVDCHCGDHFTFRAPCQPPNSGRSLTC